MKFTVKEIIITLIIASALFFIAQYAYPSFSQNAIPKVEDAYFNVTSFESPFKLALKFSLIWAAIPVICFFIWKLIPGLTSAKKLATVVLVAGGVVSAIFLRKYLAQRELGNLVVTVKNAPINNHISEALNNINFEYWMTVGLLAGTILSFILFRKKRTNGRNSKIASQKI